MKLLFSSRFAHLPKRGYYVALVATLLAVALVFGAFSFVPAAHAAVSGSSVPTSGNALVNQDFSQFVGKDPNVHVETLKLSAASCSALQKVQPHADCQVRSYWTLTTHPIFSQGRFAAVAPATWYDWSYSNWECSIISCRVWGLHLQANGVDNGSNQIWQYNVFCNASGLGDCSWHGYSNNGKSSIEVGLDGKACVSFCYSHGMRQWIRANGTLSTYYQW